MYGLIGEKIGHSFSAVFFNEKFKRENIDECYRLFPLPSINDFPSLLKEYPNLKGLNVTIPYKQQIIPFLNDLSDEAREIGAVNVIKIKNIEGKINLKGYNSDSIGFMESLLPILGPNIKNALVLGTGGASKAVAYVLNKLGIKVTFVSRNPTNEVLGYDQLNKKIISENKLIVNTTPLGMYPEISQFPPIPYHELTGEHICYDVIYNPDETEFLKKSKVMGAKVKNGIEMLHLQALAAWDIWNQ